MLVFSSLMFVGVISKFVLHESCNKVVQEAITETKDNIVKIDVKESTGKGKFLSKSEFDKLSLETEKILGKGTFATVFKDNYGDSGVCAIKRIYLKNELVEFHSYREVDFLFLLNEAKIEGAPKIIACELSGKYLTIVQTLISNSLGDKGVLERIRARPLKEKMALIKSGAWWLNEIHTLNIVHSDIKLANMGINEEKNMLYFLDFGLAKHPHEKFHGGTPRYLSPKMQDYDSHGTFEDDVWAFGFSMAQVLFGTSVLDDFSNCITEIRKNAKGKELKMEDFKKCWNFPRKAIKKHFDSESANPIFIGCENKSKHILQDFFMGALNPNESKRSTMSSLVSKLDSAIISCGIPDNEFEGFISQLKKETTESTLEGKSTVEEKSVNKKEVSSEIALSDKTKSYVIEVISDLELQSKYGKGIAEEDEMDLSALIGGHGNDQEITKKASIGLSQLINGFAIDPVSVKESSLDLSKLIEKHGNGSLIAKDSSIGLSALIEGYGNNSVISISPIDQTIRVIPRSGFVLPPPVMDPTQESKIKSIPNLDITRDAQGHFNFKYPYLKHKGNYKENISYIPRKYLNMDQTEINTRLKDAEFFVTYISQKRIIII